MVPTLKNHAVASRYASASRVGPRVINNYDHDIPKCSTNSYFGILGMMLAICVNMSFGVIYAGLEKSKDQPTGFFGYRVL